MNKHITDYLEYFINLDKPQFAVMLIGSWGCGKTFFIKSLINKWEKAENSKNKKITFKPIYISLNGVDNTNAINQKIRAKINPFLHSKGMKTAKKVLNGLVKTTLKIDMDLDSNDKSDGNISFKIDELSLLDETNNQIKGKRILIFDDIERCKIETDEIFGYINEFVEHSNCKVILISDEKKIKKKYNKNSSTINYKNFKEKLIGQTFEVKSDIETITNIFIKEIKNLKENLDLNNHSKLIIDLFIASNLQNIRILKQSLLDFNRFISLINQDLKQNPAYPEFLKCILTYFIITYSELKSGNEDIKDFQSYISYFNNDDNTNNETEIKYKVVLKKHNIRHSKEVFSVEKIYYFISNGLLENDELNNEISNNIFFKKEEPHNWETLWSWRFLEDELFKEVRASVLKKFKNNEIKEIGVLFHIIGIFLELSNNNLLTESKESIIDKSKEIMQEIFTDLQKRKTYEKFSFRYSIKGKGIQAKETPEFNLLREYYENLEVQLQTIISKKHLQNLLENINDKFIDKIDEISKRDSDEAVPFFKNIDGNKFGVNLINAQNSIISDFAYFISKRYDLENKRSSDYLKYYKGELSFLIDLKKELENNVNEFEKKLIKDYTVNKFIKELDEIINKFNKLQ
ncbi:hypothetical protein G1K52_10885 [Tenacibaculum finnmarkense]|nr:P-loop NTPase fold protein [Tenacibaculum finnmarkense]MCD8410863.1 KAP family NTPase [Tenacibaculum finnmarkense genomovar ulcerans]MCG8786260.1 hypothetical protein [Tenacibaculum finnmarkense]